MTQPSISSPKPTSPFILCCYVNGTSQIQVGRISNIDCWHLERILFPGQQFIFEAPADAQLEIYTADVASSILCERLACQRLEIGLSGSVTS